MTRFPRPPIRHLVLVLGDQLDARSSALADFDRRHDVVLMAEVDGEAQHAWSSKPRIVTFLAAMRHFAATLRGLDMAVDYQALGEHAHPDLETAIREAIRRHRPQRVVVAEPGEWRIERSVENACALAETPLAVREDAHFLVGRREFAQWARGYRQLRLESFYRWMRRRTGVLMDGDQPAGGQWNYDAANRESFGRTGPQGIIASTAFAPDGVTLEVMRLVEKRFASHPGSLDAFAWPVTRDQALEALAAFIRDRLPAFGRHQDAMWTGQPTLHHSLLSAALNLKLLDPREVVAAAEEAWRDGKAPIASVEGFIRQVLGWREFVRGLYWLDMPDLAEANHFHHARPLPRWYWTGETQMNCMREAIGQTLRLGYAHHIQRLMVTGQFALLAEIDPRQVARWYLGVYVDAVEWAELPNVAGMALYANGGRFTSKPYVASGAYIDRMSNYCRGCVYEPKKSTGAMACPFTTLYWRFLDRHEAAFAANPRTALMARSLGRLSPGQREAIRDWGERTLDQLDGL